MSERLFERLQLQRRTVMNDIATKKTPIKLSASAKQKIFHAVTNYEISKETEYTQTNTQELIQYNDQELEKKNTTQTDCILTENSHNKQIKRIRQ